MKMRTCGAMRYLPVLFVSAASLRPAIASGGAGDMCNPSWHGDGFCDYSENVQACGYDGGDCCSCDCVGPHADKTDGGQHGHYCGVNGFHCVDPSSECALSTHQQFEIPIDGYTFRVSRFSDGRDTPYRLYFQDEHLSGSSYRFDDDGNLVYFKAGSEVYSKISVDDMHLEFTRKNKSRGGKKHDDDHDHHRDSANYIWEEWSCDQCTEGLADICGDEGRGPGGLNELCGSVDYHALGSDGARSVGILCDRSVALCATAAGACDMTCNPDNGSPTGPKAVAHVTATAYDDRPGDENGCGEYGCQPALAYDGEVEDVQSRWSCSEQIVPYGGQCEITFEFEEAQDVMGMAVSFWKGDERQRSLKVTMDGHNMGEFTSAAGLITTPLTIEKDHVHTVTLESIGLDLDEWISILEVHFMAEPADSSGDHDHGSSSDDESSDDSAHDGDGYMDAGYYTVVHVSATAYDDRLGDNSGCGESNGCHPMLAYDGVDLYDVESRWSCAKKIVPDHGQCAITFDLEDPQDIKGMKVSFWKGDERQRTLKVTMDGHKMGEFTSELGSITTFFDVEKDSVHTVTLESIGLHSDQWISILEVQLLVNKH